MSRPNPDGILMALRNGTQAQHNAVEDASPWNALRAGTVDTVEARDDYIEILKQSLAFVRPLEKAILEGADPATQGAIGSLLNHTKHLEADLKTMGVSQAEINDIQDHEVPTLDTLSKKIGAAYTLIGSAMGGSVISQQVGATYDWPPIKQEAHGFKPYGNDVRAKFMGQFGGFAEAQLDAGAINKEETVASANAAFELVGEALGGHRLSGTMSSKEAQQLIDQKDSKGADDRKGGHGGGVNAPAIIALTAMLGLAGSRAAVAAQPDMPAGPTERMVDHVGGQQGGSWADRPRTKSDITR